MGAGQFDSLWHFSSVNSVATNPPSQAFTRLLQASRHGEHDLYLKVFEFCVCSILDRLAWARITVSSRNV
jgi:hypothetical protein